MIALLLACSPTRVVLDDPAFEDFVAFIGDERIATEGRRGVQIGFETTDCATPGCFQVQGDGDDWTVSGDTLGQQYGAAHLLEEMGYRFNHPWRTHIPQDLAPIDAADGFSDAPEMARRGIHMHTLHPIEGYFDAWEDPDSEGGRRIVDWVIKNRGNHLQWVALDSMPTDWETDTQALVDYGHDRGISLGLGIQLYGRSNLQLAFDLVDDEDGDQRAQMEDQWARVTGVDFDLFNLSFGEFSDTEPEAFLESVDLAYEVMRQQSDAEMTTVLHVGNDLQVEYQGETMVYYLLAQFANPEITPWVHTVMFYNLFEDAGGAYHHDDFSEHRDFVFERLQADQPVGYFPETAYWIAFDVSVPIYLPLYVRSRWLDLDRIRTTANQLGAPDLDDHVIFSTAWEWGYWQNDYAALRASYTLPSRWESYFEHMFEPFGADGASVAALVIELAQMQHEHLLVGRLTQYFAGRDLYIDLGREIDIVSQPDRPLFSELVAMSVLERATFVTNVVNKLQAASVELDRISAAVAAVSVDGNPRWYREINDAVSVTAARGRYIHALFRAVITHADTGTDDGWLAKADSALAEAQTIVDRRHGDLHYSKPDELVYGTTNATYYQWGYLKQTHELCYWTRERVEVARAIEGSSEVIPSCVF